MTRLELKICPHILITALRLSSCIGRTAPVNINVATARAGSVDFDWWVRNFDAAYSALPWAGGRPDNPVKVGDTENISTPNSTKHLTVDVDRNHRIGKVFLYL